MAISTWGSPAEGEDHKAYNVFRVIDYLDDYDPSTQDFDCNTVDSIVDLCVCSSNKFVVDTVPDKDGT